MAGIFKMTIHKGFSLLELIIISVIIAVISTMAISGIMGDIPQHKIKNDLITVEQALKTAMSTAIKTSGTITADFNGAAQGSSLGIIEIKNSDGNILDSFALNENIFYNPSDSSVENNMIKFDFKGRPVDSSGTTEGFDYAVNKVSISFYKNTTPVATGSIRIEPITAN